MIFPSARSFRCPRSAFTLAAALALALMPLAAEGQNAGGSATGKPATTGTAGTINPAQPPSGFDGARMVMTRSVWQKFVAYLNNDVSTGFGFFMISVDGQISAVRDCADYACQISPIEQESALEDCKTLAVNRRCVVFAEGRDIKMAYQVLP